MDPYLLAAMIGLAVLGGAGYVRQHWFVVRSWWRGLRAIRASASPAIAAACAGDAPAVRRLVESATRDGSISRQDTLGLACAELAADDAPRALEILRRLSSTGPADPVLDVLIALASMRATLEAPFRDSQRPWTESVIAAWRKAGRPALDGSALLPPQTGIPAVPEDVIARATPSDALVLRSAQILRLAWLPWKPSRLVQPLVSAAAETHAAAHAFLVRGALAHTRSATCRRARRKLEADLSASAQSWFWARVWAGPESLSYGGGSLDDRALEWLRDAARTAHPESDIVPAAYDLVETVFRRYDLAEPLSASWELSIGALPTDHLSTLIKRLEQTWHRYTLAETLRVAATRAVADQFALSNHLVMRFGELRMRALLGADISTRWDDSTRLLLGAAELLNQLGRLPLAPLHGEIARDCRENEIATLERVDRLMREPDASA